MSLLAPCDLGVRMGMEMVGMGEMRKKMRMGMRMMRMMKKGRRWMIWAQAPWGGVKGGIGVWLGASELGLRLK